MMKSVLNRIRYNYYFSKVTSFVAWPFYKLFQWLLKQIRTKIKINGTTLMYDSISIMFPKNVGIGFSSNIFWKGDDGFEPYTWKVIKAISQKSTGFIDIGSNFGFYSVLVHKVNSTIQSICFEPVNAIYLDNVLFHKMNKVANYEVFNLAISNQEGEDVIYLPKGVFVNEVRSASLKNNFFYNQQFEQHKLPITKITLDNFLNARGYMATYNKALVKIDVEGHELAALDGAQNFIHSQQPFIVCEIDKDADNVKAIELLLNKANYSAYAISPVGIFSINFSEMPFYSGGRDFLFAPPSSLFKKYYSFSQLELSL